MKHGPADPLPSLSFGLDNSALVVARESHEPEGFESSSVYVDQPAAPRSSGMNFEESRDNGIVPEAHFSSAVVSALLQNGTKHDQDLRIGEPELTSTPGPIKIFGESIAPNSI
jgi:hypothetical protein